VTARHRAAGRERLVTLVVRLTVAYRHDRRLRREVMGSKCER
jgi:hypothetical protein